jgi:uncharacterized protein
MENHASRMYGVTDEAALIRMIPATASVQLIAVTPAYPVFAVMFGYGLVQLASRQTAAGGDARPVLLRRNAWLIIFGFGHATLLYFGDFLSAYGIVGVIATLLLLRGGRRFDRIVLWLWTAQLAYVVDFAVLLAVRFGQSEGGNAVLTSTANPWLAAGTYGQSVLDRLAEWPMHTATVVPFIIIVWLGMWGARRRLLEDVATHRRLLQRVAAICLAITVAGAVRYALVEADAPRSRPLHDAGDVPTARGQR